MKDSHKKLNFNMDFLNTDINKEVDNSINRAEDFENINNKVETTTEKYHPNNTSNNCLSDLDNQIVDMTVQIYTRFLKYTDSPEDVKKIINNYKQNPTNKDICEDLELEYAPETTMGVAALAEEICYNYSANIKIEQRDYSSIDIDKFLSFMQIPEVATLVSEEYLKYVKYTDFPEDVTKMLKSYANEPSVDLLEDIELEFAPQVNKQVATLAKRKHIDILYEKNLDKINNNKYNLNIFDYHGKINRLFCFIYCLIFNYLSSLMAESQSLLVILLSLIPVTLEIFTIKKRFYDITDEENKSWKYALIYFALALFMFIPIALLRYSAILFVIVVTIILFFKKGKDIKIELKDDIIVENITEEQVPFSKLYKNNDNDKDFWNKFLRSIAIIFILCVFGFNSIHVQQYNKKIVNYEQILYEHYLNKNEDYASLRDELAKLKDEDPQDIDKRLASKFEQDKNDLINSLAHYYENDRNKFNEEKVKAINLYFEGNTHSFNQAVDKKLGYKALTLIEKPLPKNGIFKKYSQKPYIVPFQIINNTSDNYYIKVVDYYSPNTVVVSIFVRSNNTIEVDIPAGSYLIKKASGTTWYGEEDYFGHDTSYSKSDTKAEFTVSGDYVNGCSLTLNQTKDGNVRSLDINPEDF